MNPIFLTKLLALRHNQWLSPEKLVEIQTHKLQKIINYSYKNVKYYRQLFDSVGIKPRDIQNASDLMLIPISSRKTFQKQSPADMISKLISMTKCKKVTTAGSSGKPLTVFLQQEDFNRFGLTWARASLANGQRLFDKPVYIKFQPPPRFWFERLGIWKKNIISLMDDIDRKIKQLVQLRPQIIRGNAFELATLAHYIKKHDIKGISPGRIFSMGSLLDAKTRQLLEEVFHAEVFDFYAATEVGCIGWECPCHQGYHLNSDAVIVEFIRDNKIVAPGEMGRIICTSLDNYTMPFIRYDLGDIGIPDEKSCNCGRSLPMMKSILGRADDFFVTPAGKIISPSVIVNIVKNINGIQQFRLIQERTDLINALLVPSENYKEKNSADLRKTIKTIMGNSVTVKIELKGDIPQEENRKIRSLISNIKVEF
ncbi:MAG: phenylacetate--CoA ligase family protein [Candidatus Cloacimonetes bacterium]|nr:phenylacetate--CoA ligase family protein [Candidatus Cloacimonadota bacterium]